MKREKNFFLYYSNMGTCARLNMDENPQENKGIAGFFMLDKK